MGIWQSLYETYNQNESIAGQNLIKEYRNGNQKEYMLLPIAHTTQTAHIEITLTMDGELYTAEAIEKEITVLPFTEESGSRAGKSFKPHLLHDKLMYVAGDYAKYTGETDKQEGFENYRQQLKAWVESSYTNSTIQAIYTYINKGKLIEDLIEKRVLYVGENGLLLKKWTGEAESKPKIFKEAAGEQQSAFVRFKIHKIDEYVEVPWKDQELFENYTNYYLSQERPVGLCFVTGEKKPLASSHPNKIRNSGDKAKLISSNDGSGFTFRGRFTQANEAMSISYEASQKAHNALKFLIDRQGFTIDSRVFLLWGDQQLDLPNPNEISEDFSEGLDDLGDLIEEEKVAFTKDLIAEKFNSLIRGYKNTHISSEDLELVHIVELDAATPGRMAIINYHSLEITEYFKKIKRWYDRVLTKKQWKNQYTPLTLKEIVDQVYGPRPDSKMVLEGISKLYPCILSGRSIPEDMVRKLFQRSCLPQAYETKEYQQLLNVAATIFIDKYRERGYSMTLQLENNNRSYLFGRLLAIVDVFEERQLKEASNNRSTNALRYMTAFSTKPANVYKTIFTQLQPYFSKAATQGKEGKWSNNDFIQKKISDVMNQFAEGDFSNEPLDEQYILGYYNQRAFEYTKKGEN